MAKEWYFYDAAGTRRRVKEAYFNDASGNRRKVTAGYFYDTSGNRRQFFAGVAPPFLMTSSTLTAGRAGTRAGYSAPPNPSTFGSVSPTPTFPNHPGANLFQLDGTGSQIIMRVNGLSADPTKLSLGQLNISTVGALTGAAASYSYSAGTALWSWAPQSWYPAIGETCTISCT